MPNWIIAVDAMGGDNAPKAVCEGTLQALREMPDLSVRLYGREDEVRACLGDYEDVKSRLEVVHAEEVIDMHESPMMAVRRKTESSMVKAMLAVKNGEAQAFVSAGSTGAVLAGGMTRVGRIRGMERPALATVFPGRHGLFMLIDCGANVDCKPEYLQVFGIMGDAYMKGVMGMKEPRVGLINIGAEAEKGNALVKATYPLMEKAPYHFVGNVEARDITSDVADVLVADGFTGNVVLKFMEGMAGTLLGIIKQEIMNDTRSKLGGLMAKPAFRRVKKLMDYQEVGGAPLLGVQGAVVKAHGSSSGHAFACAIAQLVKMIEGNVVSIIEQGVSTLESAD